MEEQVGSCNRTVSGRVTVKGHRFDRLKASRVVWARLTFCNAKVLLLNQQTTCSPRPQWPSASSPQPGRAPTSLLLAATSTLYLCLFTSAYRLTDSFIATIPFLSLTASLICPCVYNRNPLKLDPQNGSKGSAQGRSSRFMEGHGGAHLTVRPQPWSNKWECALIMCLELMLTPVSGNTLWSYVSITRGGSTSWPGEAAMFQVWPPVQPRSCDCRAKSWLWAFEPCLEGDSWCQCWVSNSYRVRIRGHVKPWAGQQGRFEKGT